MVGTYILLARVTHKSLLLTSGTLFKSSCFCACLKSYRQEIHIQVLDLLGQARAELWRSGGAAIDRWAGPRGSWRQSHRPHVHRRSQRRLAVSSMHKAGFANQPSSVSAEDGLRLIDCAITAACHCAPPDNKPLPEELRNCQGWLDATCELLPTRVIVALGQVGWRATLDLARRRDWLSGSLPKLRMGPKRRWRTGGGSWAVITPANRIHSRAALRSRCSTRFLLERGRCLTRRGDRLKTFSTLGPPRPTAPAAPRWRPIAIPPPLGDRTHGLPSRSRQATASR